jgi:phosphoribosylaminoimidazole-succinocarboxamide synthase
MAHSVTSLDIPLKRLGSGKVREMFEISAERLLICATDRISAFDVIMEQGIPDKGRVLNGMTVFWLEDLLSGVCPNHLISSDPTDILKVAGGNSDAVGRSMIVERLEMLPIEFVIRGYLAGSGWKDYTRSGSVCGIPLPKGLQASEKLPEPIFTPATKASSGHDINISEDEAAEVVGAGTLKKAKEFALELYSRAADHAADKGIIIADTKFEFGLQDGEIVLGDEVLTPDSSRFWPVDSWKLGESPPSFDKQFVRDWLETQDWNKAPPPPELPSEILEGSRSRYIEAYETVTGKNFSDLPGG